MLFARIAARNWPRSAFEVLSYLENEGETGVRSIAPVCPPGSESITRQRPVWGDQTISWYLSRPNAD